MKPITLLKAPVCVKIGRGVRSMRPTPGPYLFRSFEAVENIFSKVLIYTSRKAQYDGS